MSDFNSKLHKEQQSFSDKVKTTLLRWMRISNQPVVKVYNGYGDNNQLLVYGHVFLMSPIARKRFSSNIFTNTFSLLRLFIVKPFKGARVRLLWEQQSFDLTTEEDGFYRFEWKPQNPVQPGWHPVTVHLLNPLDDYKSVRATGNGFVMIPHANEYSCVSDIDDTFLISHSTNLRRRLYVLLTKNAHSRKPFEGVMDHYKLLAKAGKTPDQNAFFYVSSSEWNLYDYIVDFSIKNELPKGVYLLSQVKRLSEAWKTGQNKHATKFMRIARIMEAYPHHKFILLGDDTQEDPKIYLAVIQHFPDKIFCVYLRQVLKHPKPHVQDIVTQITNAGVACCYFKHSGEAMIHSKKIGLVMPNA